MNTNELVTRASELTDKIYTEMGKVEQCDALASKIDGLMPVFLDTNGVNYVVVDSVLDQEQLEMVRKLAISLINKNKEGAEQFLRNILGDYVAEPKENLCESKDEVAEPCEEVTEPCEEVAQEEEPVPEEPELDYDVVKFHVQKTTESYRAIADYLKVPYKKLYNFIVANGLLRPKKVKGDWRG